MKALKGTLVRSYPPKVEVGPDQEADLEITGGVGHVPVTFSGLKSPTGFAIIITAGGASKPFDQSVHGNDFWQTGPSLRTSLSGRYPQKILRRIEAAVRSSRKRPVEVLRWQTRIWQSS